MIALATWNGSITDRLKKNKEENIRFQDINNFITYIILQVLEVGEVLPPNVHYALNQMVAEPTKFVYKWDQLGPWTQCSRLCQGTTQIYTRFVYVIKFNLHGTETPYCFVRDRTARHTQIRTSKVFVMLSLFL